MSEVTTYKDLVVWRASVDLAVQVYALTDRFPRAERFGLISQMRRAAVSIPANVAEGNSRHSTRAYMNHVHIALGSAGELAALIEVSRRLSYLAPIDASTLSGDLERVGRMLSGLRAALQRRVKLEPDDSAP